MKRLIIILIIIIPLGAVGVYFFNQYWIHRYDALIAQQAAIYHLDPDLVWSVIYEETYFRPWKIGNDGEIGLMQVTPTVGQEWAAQTGMNEFARQMQHPESALRDPERNIQVGCWYLEKFYEEYRDTPGWEARMIAGYNAGKSRVDKWNQTEQVEPPLTDEQFIQRIDIPPAIARHLPLFLFGPLAGVVVDRVNRRRVMIVADVSRAVLALGFLLAERMSTLPVVYIVGASLFAVSSFFNAAKRASIPNLVHGTSELFTPNSLSASTTAATIAVGSALGGLLSTFIGRNAVFILNAATFLVSAEMIRRIRTQTSGQW